MKNKNEPIIEQINTKVGLVKVSFKPDFQNLV